MIGGATGRDGIGGATGSSKEHNETSLEKCSSEVQKGNALIERKFMGMDTASILFFNKEGSAMLKIFLGRDDHRQLLSEQVSAFHALAASLKEHA